MTQQPRNIILLIIGVVVSIVIACISAIAVLFIEDEENISPTDSPDLVVLEFETLELADEPEEQAQGLKFRESLCDTCGMLFDFGDEAIRSFWMQDTLISLDMVFINKEGVIVTIHEDTVPLQERPTYVSLEPAQYVLEVNGGGADALSLEVGDALDVEQLKEVSQDFVWVP